MPADTRACDREAALRRFFTHHAHLVSADEADDFVAELRLLTTPLKYGRALDSILRIVVQRLLSKRGGHTAGGNG